MSSRRPTRAHVRALAYAAFAWAIAAASATGAIGASSTTVVSVHVPSATELTRTTCANGTDGSTSFGIVLPGSMRIGSADCVLTWGSSNDSSTLRIFQSDRQGSAMFRPATGTMDSSFGGDGISDAVDAGGDDELRSMAVQSTGRVLLGTLSGRISRLLADGTLDTGFGASGHLTVSGHVGTPHALLVDASDRIYALGSNGGRASVARYSAAGVLDGTFGSGGVAAYGPFQSSEVGIAMSFDPSGRIVVSGRSDDGVSSDIVVLRLTADGALDLAFAGGVGYRIVQVNASSLLPVNAVASDGSSFTVARDSSSRALVVKLDSSGALPGAFGSSGLATVDVPGGSEELRDVAIAPDGDVVAVGDWSSNALAIRLDPTSGAPRASFGGGDGIVNPNMAASAEDVWRSVVIQPDGRVVVQGRADLGAPEGFELGVHRLLADGSFDPSFGGGDGITWHHVTAGSSVDDRGSYHGELALWTDGSIVAGGETSDPANAFAIRMAGTTFPDWASGTNDWAVADAGAFAACLHLLGAPAIAQAWPVAGAGNCASTLPANWRAVPTASTAIGRLGAAGTTTVHMRFGVRATSNQAPGDYVAPVAFEVVAP